MLRSNYVYALLYAVLCQACCKQYSLVKMEMGSSSSSFSNTGTNKDDFQEKNVCNKQCEEILRLCKSSGVYQDNKNSENLFKAQASKYGINFEKQNTEKIKK